MRDLIISAVLTPDYLSRESSLMLLSLVFGWKPPKPTTLSHLLEVTGMQHVTSASGFNVGLMVSLVKPLTSRFWGWYKLALFGMGLVTYYFLTDRSPAIQRATIMSGVALLCRFYWHRQYQPLRVLVVTALGMMCVQPQLIESISFQLSVAATTGIALACHPTNPWAALVTGQVASTNGKSPHFRIWHLGQWWLAALLSTCAAQLLTIPLVLHYFKSIPLVSFIANPTLLWLVPWITQIGVAWVIVGCLKAGFSGTLFVWWIMSQLLSYLFWFLNMGLSFFARFSDYQVIHDQFTWIMVAGWWGSVGAIFLAINYQRKQPFKIYLWEKAR